MKLSNPFVVVTVAIAIIFLPASYGRNVERILQAGDISSQLTSQTRPLSNACECGGPTAREDNSTLAFYICNGGLNTENYCRLIKRSPAIYAILNNNIENVSLSELDEQPGWNTADFLNKIENSDNTKWTVFAAENRAIKKLARQAVTNLFNEKDPEYMEFVAENPLNIRNFTEVEGFILSRSGRLCRNEILLNTIKEGESKLDQLNCGDKNTMLGSKITETECDQSYPVSISRSLQNSFPVTGTSKYQVGEYNGKNSYGDEGFGRPEIVIADQLVSNGVLHLTSDVVMPKIEPKIIYETQTIYVEGDDCDVCPELVCY